MNQEILIRLEKQAEKLVLEIPASLDCDEYTALFNEKFAELIVRECAELCLKHETMIGPFNTTEFRKGRHFNTIIKHHFGVEE